MPPKVTREEFSRMAEDRMIALGLPLAARDASRAALAASLQADAEASAAALDAAGEALAERMRVAAVVRAGRDMGRPRQALRLALSLPISEGEAKAVLATMPTDADAPDAALALPTAGNFGGEAAQGERARILKVFGHPAAQGRFTSAQALALASAEATPPEAIIAVLAGLPVEAAPKTAAEILSARAEGLGEFGPSSGEAPAFSRAEASRSSWSRAVAEANRQIGAAPTDAPVAAPQLPAGPFDRGAA